MYQKVVGPKQQCRILIYHSIWIVKPLQGGWFQPYLALPLCTTRSLNLSCTCNWGLSLVCFCVLRLLELALVVLLEPRSEYHG